MVTSPAFRLAWILLLGVLTRTCRCWAPSGTVPLAPSRSLVSPMSRQDPCRHPRWIVPSVVDRQHSSCTVVWTHSAKEAALPDDSEEPSSLFPFEPKNAVTLVASQATLIVVSVGAAKFLNIPNGGLGPNIAFSLQAIQTGLWCTTPLIALGWFLDSLEDRIPALLEVTKATQRSILALLGGTFQPLAATLTSIGMGLAAGFGEEMLFRGVLQSELASKAGLVVAVGVSSVIFGALHAVTPLYAGLALLASVYFGSLYIACGNLAVPIVTHTVYDIGALMLAHWQVTQLSQDEQQDLAEWNESSNDSPTSTIL